MNELELLIVNSSNELYDDVFKRRAWNRSMQRGFRQCSLQAKQWINTMDARNRSSIEETKILLGDKYL